MDYEREILFGVFDSELMHQEISIPDGFTATIEGDKIILTRTESEDEKIRKAIHIYLDWLDGRKDYAPRGEYTIRDMIAWLEKQCESTDINPSEFDLRLNKLLKQFETLSKEELTSSLSFYLNVIQNDGTYREEKQGEQKPTDKVEPKFHKGGWVVDNAGYIWKIKGILNKFYILEGVEGGESCPTTEWADDTFHLWTIKDAKDGDILQLGVVTAIFQKYIGNGNCKCYCSVCEGIFEIPSQDDDDDYYGCHDATPATKEQRDTLFSKMEGAGYEWDAEKKELKKIEDEEYNGEDYGIDSLFHAQEILERTLGKVDGYQTDDGILAHQCAITAVKKLYEHKPAEWSEEDETRLTNIIIMLKEGASHHFIKDDITKAVDWLKSLRPQKQWKPTEEQVEAFEHFIRSISESGYASPYENNTKLLYSLLNDLKKLKE